MTEMLEIKPMDYPPATLSHSNHGGAVETMIGFRTEKMTPGTDYDFTLDGTKYIARLVDGKVDISNA